MADASARAITAWKLKHTAVVYIGNFARSFYLCLLGPSLLDLQLTSNTTTKSMTTVFMGRPIGGILGSALFGCILYRWNRPLVMAASYLIMAASMTSLPWLNQGVALAVVYGIGGVAYAIADVGSFTYIMRIWGKRNATWLQALYTSYYIGCLITPLIAKPFLVSERNDTCSGCLGNQLLHDPQNNKNSITHGFNTTDYFSPTSITYMPVTSDTLQANKIPIWKAFLIAGSILGISMFASLLLYVFDAYLKSPASNYAIEHRENHIDATKRGTFVRLMIVQVTVFIFWICCVQRGASSYLFAYVVRRRFWEKTQAVLLKTAHQFGVLVGCISSVYLQIYIRPQVLLTACVFGAVVASAALTFAGNIVPIMWTGTVLLGLCLGPMYGCILSWGHQHFIVDGRVGAMMVFSVGAADMIGSLVINLLYDRYGLDTFIYLTLLVTISMTLNTFSIFLTIKCLKKESPHYLPATSCSVKFGADESKL